MNLRFRLGIITLGALVVLATFTYPLWRPLIVDDVINEAFPGLPADLQDDFLRLPRDQQNMLYEMRGENEQMAVDTAMALVSGDTAMQESMPEMQNPVIVGEGEFIQIDVIHGASGSATIYSLPDDKLVLRFEDFRSTNGPDLHVVLSRAEDPRSHDELGADYRDLGQLKGNVGNQNYEIPSDFNIEDFNSVVIYCLPFQVVFSTATLE